ncbi:hypothetical protein [Fimbriiglobus ruber]|nr:hypothetical protein [Fimbriiglobus ruber]
MFQQMTHCQGVFTHRRCFLVDWRTVPPGEEHWCALVIRGGGLNQPHPTHPASHFRDHDASFPIVGMASLTDRTERRYRFWGDPSPGMWGDGHCINFLEYDGKLFLYDPSFGTGPFEIDHPLPPDNLTVLGGSLLDSFKANYLDTAVDYMLGSLYNGSNFYKSDQSARANGITVKTVRIPATVNGNNGITFGWGG